MKFWISALLFPAFIFSAEIVLPKEFFLYAKSSEKNLQIDLKTQNNEIGLITKAPSFPIASFQFYNPNKKLLSQTNTQYYCWGTVAEVYSPMKQKIGWIEEQMFQWFSKPICRIFDQTDHIVAIAKKNYWGTRITIHDAHEPAHIISILHRPWFQYHEDNVWTIEIIDSITFEEKKLDPNLLIYVAAHQCDRELQSHKASNGTENCLFVHSLLSIVHPFLGDNEVFFAVEIQKHRDQISQLIQQAEFLPYKRKIYHTRKEFESDEDSVESYFQQFAYFDFELPDYQEIMDTYEAKMFTILSKLHEIKEVMEHALFLVSSSDLFEEQKRTIYSLLCEYIDEYRSIIFD